MTDFLPPIADGAADHLMRGLALPEVSLPATPGEDVCVAALPGPSVIAVYPWTGRPGYANPPNWDHIPGAHGSTPELEAFRDLSGLFARHGVSLFGLSGQTPEHHAELSGRLALPFVLLSDAQGRFATALALPSFLAGERSYLKRLSLVVKDGRIENVFYPVFDPAGHAAEVLAWIGK